MRTLVRSDVQFKPDWNFCRAICVIEVAQDWPCNQSSLGVVETASDYPFFVFPHRHAKRIIEADFVKRIDYVSIRFLVSHRLSADRQLANLRLKIGDCGHE
jgi:hypothetical protein